MDFASSFVYSAVDDADDFEEVEQEEEETIDDLRRRHQASSDDGQVKIFHWGHGRFHRCAP